MESSFVDFNYMISSLTEKSLIKLNFNIELEENHKDLINDNMYFIIDKLKNHAPLITLFKNKIINTIEKETSDIDWHELICCNREIFYSAINVRIAL
jgi:hypothetical protein